MIKSFPMKARLTRKAISILITLFLVSVIVYAVMSLIPGSRAQILFGDAVSESTYQQWKGENETYLSWLGSVLQLDFGLSNAGSMPVSSLIASRIPVSLVLALCSLFLAAAFSVAVVFPAVLRPGRLTRLVYNFFSLISLCLPSFLLALILILVFSVWTGLLPSGGYVSFFSDPLASMKSLILPSVSLGFLHSGLIMRMMYSSMQHELGQAYIRQVRAKGVSERQVLLKHVLPNVMSQMTVLVMQSFVVLFTSSAAVEYIFSVPGLGALTVSAIGRRDFNTIVALVLLGTLASSISSGLGDLISDSRDRRVSG